MQQSADGDRQGSEDHWGFGSADDLTADVSAPAAPGPRRPDKRRPDNHPYRDPRHGLLARRRRMARELEQLEKLRASAQQVREHLGLVDELLAQSAPSAARPRWALHDALPLALPLALRSAMVMGAGASLGVLLTLLVPWRAAHERAQEATIAHLEAELAASATSAPSSIAPAAEPTPVPALPAPVEAPASARPPWPVRDLEAIFDHHVSRLDADTFEVERGYVQELVHTGSSTMHRVRALPHSEGGRVVGVRIYGIRPEGIAGRLGLRSGDTLIAINGLEMASADSAFRAYASLREADVMALLIERRHRRQILVYHLVDELSSSSARRAALR